MLDIKLIRQNPDLFDQAMINRSSNYRSAQILEIDEKKREIQTKIQEFQALRNDIAKKIGFAKKNGENSDDLFAQSKVNNENIAKIEQESRDLELELEDVLMQVPNIADENVPIGADENDNVEIEKVGEVPKFDFEPKPHYEIGEKLGMLDFEQSTVLSGARFSTLSGDLASLERALSNYMIDIAVKNGHQEISPPNLVKSGAMRGSGQLPKFSEDAFETKDGYWLIPTAEVPLVNMVAQKILTHEELPLRFVAYTPCFRSEAGSAGRDTRGMIRQHQFKKVELVAITDDESSKEEHEKLTKIAQSVLEGLGLAYRKVLLCSGDMGFCAQKTYDLEVWLPFEGKYREISSCSNCGDFQGRRMKARYKKDKKNHFVHSLNGSSLAVGRTIVAILENYQNSDGSVRVPDVLQGYMGGKTVISA